MRISVLALTALIGHVSGFASVRQHETSFPSLHSSSRTRLFVGTPQDGSRRRTKPMSAEELKARMGIQDDEPPPKLFSDSLYDDMQQTLLLLEKRIAQGPGSLSLLEVESLGAQTQRIIVEMRSFEANRVSGQGIAKVGGPPPPPVAPVQEQVVTPAAEIVQSKEITDISNDEGPAYDGKGGFGLSRGTRNTYVIPGMDEMSSEEYRLALQQSLIDRQSSRKKSGTTGNRATWDYLNNLSGERGVLKKDVDDEQP